jgi:hypothetical protein
MPAEYGGSPLTVGVPSYRGLENPFGHLFCWTDGCKCRIPGDVNEKPGFFVCSNPDKFQDTDLTGYEFRGNLPREGGWIKEMLVGGYGENMPARLGSSSSLWFCDSYLGSGSGGSSEDVLEGVVFGGFAELAGEEGIAGLGCSASIVPEAADPAGGTRLCFLI